MAPMTITGVTADDVETLTGIAPDYTTLASAVAMIELFASVDLSDFSRFNARDRRWLHDAVCWQAAWLTAQPDIATRSDFASMSQDGLSLATRDMTSLILAPLARKALSRVSWVRARTTNPRRASVWPANGLNQALAPAGAPITDNASDNWQAM